VKLKMSANMINLPPKFNQICRLCLTLVSEPAKHSGNEHSDEIVKKLSIFNTNGQQHSKSQKQNNNKKSNDYNDDQLNKKAKRSNEISVSLSGGINGYTMDDDDDSDISERIFQLLALKVSHQNPSLSKIKIESHTWN
jgi:hypothetical protein